MMILKEFSKIVCVSLFSYQGSFVLFRSLATAHLVYHVRFRLSRTFLSFFNFFFEAILLSSSISFSEEVVLLCRATFISYHTCFILSRTFFICLKIFFPISFKSMCSHVQRMLSYHRVCVTSSVFSLFYFFF